MKAPAVQEEIMNTNIANELELSKAKAQYDEYAKRILSNVWVLAWILKSTTPEFENTPIEQIVEECIGDDILISKVRMRPGETNSSENQPERITGDNTEDKVPDEGTIFYDIRFSAYVPNCDESVKILLNVEAQRIFYVGYSLVTRGIFYAARMISAQFDTEFVADDYSGLKKVYSIWICMDAPDYIGNAISEYSIKKMDIIEGMPDIKEAYDKMSVILICLNRGQQKSSDEKGLIGMLITLFANDIDVKDKEKILSDDYGIAMSHDIVREMGHMCNLSEGIWERGVREGIEQGIERGSLLKIVRLIRSKLIKGKSVKDISDILEEPIDFVCEIITIIEENPTFTDLEIAEKYLG